VNAITTKKGVQSTALQGFASERNFEPLHDLVFRLIFEGGCAALSSHGVVGKEDHVDKVEKEVGDDRSLDLGGDEIDRTVK